MKKKINNQKIYKDNKGEYIKQCSFVRGKQVLTKIYVVDGLPVDEFYEKNADPITLLQDEFYELLDQHEF